MSPPDGTAVRPSNVLTQVVEENPISTEDEVTYIEKLDKAASNERRERSMTMDLLYQLRMLWMSSSSWLILCRKSPCLDRSFGKRNIHELED